MIAIVIGAFLIGLYFMPNDGKSVADIWEGTPKDEDPKDKFKVPEKGGVLQNMAKDKDDNISLKLDKIIEVSGDTYIFRFGFDDKKAVFGLPIGNHVVFSA